MMNLVNQVRPSEQGKGAAEGLAEDWVARLGKELGSSKRIHYGHIRKNYREMVQAFRQIPMEKRETVKVGIVGEIFVKYSPLANNDLERFLIGEGGQPVVPGLVDFCLYVVYNRIADHKIYHNNTSTFLASKVLYRFLNKKRMDLSEALESSG